MFFRCLNIECLIKSGAIRDVHKNLLLFSDGNKITTFEPKLEKLIKEVKLELSGFNKTFWTFVQHGFLLSELQVFDELLLETTHELTCSNSYKKFDTAGKYDVVELFNILTDQLSHLNLTDRTISVFDESKKALDSQIHLTPCNIQDCYSDEFEINVSFDSHVSRRRKHELLFCNTLKYLSGIIKKVYNTYQNTRIQYFTQLVRTLIFLIFTLSDKDSKHKFVFPQEIYLYIGLFLCLNDFMFQLSNWETATKANIFTEITFIICLIYPETNNLKSIISLSSLYTSIFRILFIFQCRLFYKYSFFQVKEVIRIFLKKVFISADTNFDSAISFSQLETVCFKFGIDINQEFTRKIDMDKYMLNCLREKSIFGDIKYLFSDLYNYIFVDKTGQSQYLENLKKIEETSKHSQICKLLLKSIEKIAYFIKINPTKNLTSNRQRITVREAVGSRNIDYKEFEELILSLDNNGKILMNISEKHSLNLFDINSYLFSRRRNSFENTFFVYSLSFCLSIFILIISLASFPGTFEEVLKRDEKSVKMVITCFYLVIVIVGIVSHYKTDIFYYNSALNFVSKVSNKYDKIFGITNDSCVDNRNILGKGNCYLKEDCYYNGIYNELLITELIETLNNTINSFSNYLPLNITHGILRSNRIPLPIVHYNEVTILFTDIVGFTNIAEKLCPFKLFELLTEYFDEMITIINNYNGTLLEIVGDSILVIWNSSEIENHRSVAISACLQMKKKLKSKSKMLNEIYNLDIEIKCGVHTDNALVGNIGGKKRMKYGILGDGVNLASRIESLCKRYNAEIIITNNVFIDAQVQTKFIIYPLDVVIVQGRCKPTVIYEVIDSISNNSNSLLISKLHTIAFILFLNMEFSHSIRYLERINKLNIDKGNFTPNVLYYKCKHFLKKKPGTNWMRAEVLTTKNF